MLTALVGALGARNPASGVPPAVSNAGMTRVQDSGRVLLGQELLEALGVVERPDQREPQRVRAEHVLRDALHVLGA